MHTSIFAALDTAAHETRGRVLLADHFDTRAPRDLMVATHSTRTRAYAGGAEGFTG
jgi:hypothetical protein